MAAGNKIEEGGGAVAIEVRDKEYRAELIREIELKENRSLFLLQEIQFLKTLLKQVDQGLTREEIKANIEHNPFEDFDFFGWRNQRNGKK